MIHCVLHDPEDSVAVVVVEGVKAGAILTPGQSETWTVALAPGTYRYHCDIDPSGMKGSFTVTP